MKREQLTRTKVAEVLNTAFLCALIMKDVAVALAEDYLERRKVMRGLGRIGVGHPDFLNPDLVKPSFTDDDIHRWMESPASGLNQALDT